MNPLPLYARAEYVRSLMHVGLPHLVDAWQSHVLARSIGNGRRDASGPYPLTVIASEGDVVAGLEQLRNAGMVSAVIVADGLTGKNTDELRAHFDVARTFKTHYLVDHAADYCPSPHHRYEIRRSLGRGVEVRDVPPGSILDEWVALYEGLVEKREVEGIANFPRASFEALLQCPGLLATAAYLRGELVSAHLWVLHDGIAWSHLAASSLLGYQNSATYALYDHAIRSLPARVVNLGGSAGPSDDTEGGLARFKAGFANRQHSSWLMGAVLDKPAYSALSQARRTEGGQYFPEYRAPIG